MELIDVLVWAGTLTFAATGALVAVHKRFDLVGVPVPRTYQMELPDAMD